MQSVKCLTVDPGIASLIFARSHTFVEIDLEIISTAFPLFMLIQEGFLSVKQNYVHEVLVNSLVKLSRKQVGVGELTVLA